MNIEPQLDQEEDETESGNWVDEEYVKHKLGLR